MPDVFTLNAAPSLVRLRIAEVSIATANDDEDARAGTLAKLTLFHNRLGLERGVIDALDLRLATRPPLPVLETTQNLVRRARRRLEQERLGAARAQNDLRLVAVTHLRAVLEP